MATKQQIPVLANRLSEFQKEFLEMTQDDTQWAIQNTKEAIRLSVQAIANRPKTTVQTAAAILSDVVCTSSVIPATITKKFVVQDNFKADISENAKVKISYLGGNFKSWFWGKVEDPFAGSVLFGRQLKKNLVDDLIIAELGGHEKAETTMAEIYAMMEHQANGKTGDLLISDWSNIFFVRDVNSTLRAVRVSWRDGGWDVCAYSINYPIERNAGDRVFSHKPQN